jgi:hypothetical protein
MKTYNKKLIQLSLDRVILEGEFNELYGKQVLALAEAAVMKRGLYYRFTEFEVNYIIKPRIVDNLLLKSHRYNKEMASAYTFVQRIIQSAIQDAVRKVHAEKKGELLDVFYYDDMVKKLEETPDEIDLESLHEIDVVFDIVNSNLKN